MSLRDDIENAVDAGRILVSGHAAGRLRERRILLWQVTSSLSDGRLLVERSSSRPHPCIEVEQTLADGTAVKVVWSYDELDNEARLVTVHYFDR